MNQLIKATHALHLSIHAAAARSMVRGIVIKHIVVVPESSCNSDLLKHIQDAP